MQRRALLIGINYYKTKSELHGCINDIEHVRNYLKTYCGFQDSEILMLRDDSKDSQHQPTGQNIFNGFFWLTKDAKPESRLFIHYSGHGSYIRDRSGDEADGRDETICPVDYATNGMITDDQLRKYLAEPLPAGCRMTALFDSCHSGTVLDLRCNYKINKTRRGCTFSIDVDKHYPNTQGKVTLISGCKDNQTSADAWEERQSQGAMTYSFLKTMKKLRIKGKHPTYGNMIKNLTFFVKKKGYQQIPQLSTGRLVDLSSKFSII